MRRSRAVPRATIAELIRIAARAARAAGDVRRARVLSASAKRVAARPYPSLRSYRRDARGRFAR